MKKEYVLYKGETLLEIGTAEMLAKIFNVTEKTIRFYSTPAYLKRCEKRHKGNYKIAIKLD